MPSLATLLTFAGIVAVFAAAPGPSNLYVVAQGMRAGRRPALEAALGCACGAMAYVVATTLGLAAILASSATALSVLHYVGGAYLLLLAIRAFRERPDDRDEAAPAPSQGHFLRRGFLVELSNPKVALFFVAFFPQFVHPDRGAAWSQILVLGAVFCAVGLLSDSLYAVTAGTFGSRFRRVANRTSGTLYLGLGAWAIWSGTRTHST